MERSDTYPRLRDTLRRRRVTYIGDLGNICYRREGASNLPSRRTRQRIKLGEVDKFHGHCRYVARIEGLSDADHPLDREHLASLTGREMDVVHVLFPIVARTRTDPKPRCSPPARSQIPSASQAGRLTKVQVAVRRASHTQSSASRTTFTRLSLSYQPRSAGRPMAQEGSRDRPQTGWIPSVWTPERTQRVDFAQHR
jgi:hypothetical protein